MPPTDLIIKAIKDVEQTIVKEVQKIKSLGKPSSRFLPLSNALAMISYFKEIKMDERQICDIFNDFFLSCGHGYQF